MATRDIKLNSTAKVGITNFLIRPEVMGGRVDFIYDKHEVSIRLPAEYDDEQASVVARITNGGAVTKVAISSLNIQVKTTGKIAVPVEMLSSRCNAYDIADEGLVEELDSRIFKYQHIANGAINVWLRCLRWKRNDWRVGRYGSSVGRYVDVSQVNLINRESDKKIWHGPLHFTAPGCTAISKECWEAVASSLKNNETSPVYYDLLFDSEAHLDAGEIKRALVEAAMATEIFIRTIVENRIPDNLNRNIKDYIGRISIRKVFESFLPEHLDSVQREVLSKDNNKLKSEILRLFEHRNTIMHSGVIDRLDRDLCSIHISNVKKLFAGLG